MESTPQLLQWFLQQPELAASPSLHRLTRGAWGMLTWASEVWSRACILPTSPAVLTFFAAAASVSRHYITHFAPVGADAGTPQANYFMICVSCQHAMLLAARRVISRDMKASSSGYPGSDIFAFLAKPAIINAAITGFAGVCHCLYGRHASKQQQKHRKQEHQGKGPRRLQQQQPSKSKQQQQHSRRLSTGSTDSPEASSGQMLTPHSSTSSVGTSRHLVYPDHAAAHVAGGQTAVDAVARVVGGQSVSEMVDDLLTALMPLRSQLDRQQSLEGGRSFPTCSELTTARGLMLLLEAAALVENVRAAKEAMDGIVAGSILSLFASVALNTTKSERRVFLAERGSLLLHVLWSHAKFLISAAEQDEQQQGASVLWDPDYQPSGTDRIHVLVAVMDALVQREDIGKPSGECPWLSQWMTAVNMWHYSGRSSLSLHTADSAKSCLFCQQSADTLSYF